MSIKITISIISKYAKPHLTIFTGFVIALACSSISVLALSHAIKTLIDTGFTENLHNSLLVFFNIVIVLSIATALRYYFITLLSEKIICQIRKDIFSTLIYQPRIYFEKNKVGQLLSSSTNDIAIIQTFIATNLSIFLRNLVILVGGIIILITTSMELFFYILILIPIVILPILILAKSLKKQSNKTQNIIAEMMSLMTEYLSSIKTIQSFCKEDFAKQEFSKKIDQTLKFSHKRILIRSILTFFAILFVFSSILFLIKQAAILVTTNSITKGELTSFIFVAVLVAASFGAITEVMSEFFKSLGAFDRIIDILSSKCNNNYKDFKKQQIITSKIFPIKINDLSFSYPSNPNTKILDKINLAIDEKQIIAIVGASGAGKSTIFDLLLRFYEYNSGKITLGNLSSRDISIKTLRSNFSLVPQEPFIFSTSVIENIALNDKYDEKKIIEALEISQAIDFVNKLPNKLNTNLGENGIFLSTGQKQRIAIARCIYNKSPIILLDEATSNLDSNKEQEFIKCLNNIKKSHSIIIIAHRLSTIQNADKIFVLNDGKIIEEGIHQDLFLKKGLYKKIFNIQNNDVAKL